MKGTRHVFDTSLETPEGSRNWAINVVDIPEDIGDAWLVVGYSGTGSPTGRMVAKVANLISEFPQRMQEMEAIANITRAGLTALSAGNLEGLGVRYSTSATATSSARKNSRMRICSLILKGMLPGKVAVRGAME